jgi:hypothetical protein
MLNQKYEKDPVVIQCRKQPGNGFYWNNDKILLFNGRIYIPTGVRKQFVEMQHALPAHGHQGISKTYSRISRNFFFPGMRKTIEEICSNCDTYIRNKTSRQAPTGQLQPVETPKQPWKSIALDFVIKLPISKDPTTGLMYDSILMITERLTKYVYFIPFKEASTAK